MNRGCISFNYTCHNTFVSISTVSSLLWGQSLTLHHIPASNPKQGKAQSTPVYVLQCTLEDGSSLATAVSTAAVSFPQLCPQPTCIPKQVQTQPHTHTQYRYTHRHGITYWMLICTWTLINYSGYLPTQLHIAHLQNLCISLSFFLFCLYFNSNFISALLS